MDLKSTLLPCPWCGCIDTYFANVEAEEWGSCSAVACNECAAQGPYAETRQGAEILWNLGPSVDPAKRKTARAEQLEAEAKALEAKAAGLRKAASEVTA